MMVGEQIKKYAKKLEQLFSPFKKNSVDVSTSHRVCITISAKDLSLIHINRLKEASDVLFYQNIQYDDFESLTHVLTKLVAQYQLKGIPTSWLLSPDDYQIFLIESLPVAKEEFKEALNWRIRSLIPNPIEEVVIDYFMLPPKKKSPDNPMIAAITASMPQLSTIIETIKKSGLHLTTIDIPELAIRNLVVLSETSDKTIAFIYLYEEKAILNITHKKTLYFTRHINLTKQLQSTQNNYEQLSLEILRYFDYFQGEWRLPPPNQIFVAGGTTDIAGIARKLTDYLLLTVQPFSPSTILTNKKLNQALEQKYLLLLGCALKQEGSDVTSRD